MKDQPQELHPTLLSASSLNGLRRGVSSTRDTMYTGMLGQIVTINGATRRRLRADVEYHFGSATFKKEIEEDSVIVDIIQRFPPTTGWDSIKKNPLTIVLYQNYHTKELNALEVHEFNSMHPDFGFRYKMTDAYENLAIGEAIPAGTVLAKSPNLTEDGDYMYGVEANVIYTSHQSGNEDGVRTSESFMKKIVPTRYEQRTFTFGSNHFPINRYGNDQHVKIMPDIGERVDSTGLLVALREYNILDGVVNMTKHATTAPDYIYDKLIYAIPNAKVVDIQVERNDDYVRCTATPEGLDEQLYKYYNADMLFYRRLLQAYQREQRKYGDALTVGPELQVLLVQALGHCHVNPEFRDAPYMNLFRGMDAEKYYRNGKMDEWKVTVTFESDTVPDMGFKLSGEFGDKVIVCKVVPDEYMPIDEHGNRADIMLNDAAATDRIIVSTMTGVYLNASARDTSKQIRLDMGYCFPEDTEDAIVWKWFNDPSRREVVEKGFATVMGWYDIVSPMVSDMLKQFVEKDGYQAKKEHMFAICRDGIYPHFPTDNPVFVPEMINKLKKKYRPWITPVTYKGQNGQMLTTKEPILIGSKYIIVLEKTGEDWSAVADPRRSHFGTVASITNSDKYASAVRKQPVKAISESETVSISAYAGADHLIDVTDAINSPINAKMVYRTILTAPDLTNIEELFDRQKYPVGDHRPVQLVNHMGEMSGKRIARATQRKS